MTPVPGPTSSTGRPDFVSMIDAMRRAVTELVGTMEPTARGLSIQPLKNFSSSSNFDASLAQSRTGHRRSPSDGWRTHNRPLRQRKVARRVSGEIRRIRDARVQRSPKDSKKSFMREKKPLDCGEFSFDDSFSNSSSSSRWRLVRFCGVSTAIWM